MVDRNIHEEDIEIWLDALKGRDTLSTPPEILREAKAVQNLLAAHVEKRLVPANEHDVQRFIFRLKKEGLLKSERRISGVFAALASIGFVVLALVIMQPWKALKQESLEDSQVWRGGEDAQVLKANHPQQLANEIMGILSQSQLTARRIDHQNQIQIQAKIPAEAISARSELQRLGIVVPDHGRLFLRLLKP
jgi:hypothetical protein